MDCPHCKNILEPLLVMAAIEKPVSYHCDKCDEEFYVCNGDKLLTRDEFFEAKKEFNG